MLRSSVIPGSANPTAFVDGDSYRGRENPDTPLECLAVELELRGRRGGVRRADAGRCLCPRVFPKPIDGQALLRYSFVFFSQALPEAMADKARSKLSGLRPPARHPSQPRASCPAEDWKAQ